MKLFFIALVLFKLRNDLNEDIKALAHVCKKAVLVLCMICSHQTCRVNKRFNHVIRKVERTRGGVLLYTYRILKFAHRNLHPVKPFRKSQVTENSERSKS